MRLVIECIERVGVAQDILSLLANQNINLDGIELERQSDKGLIYLRIEKIDTVQQNNLVKALKKIRGVSTVKSVDHLPQERKNLALRALLEALPNPVLSIDPQGKITFANSQAIELLLPIYRTSLPKKKQPQTTHLEGVLINDIIVNLNRTKWYHHFLLQGLAVQQDTLQPISNPIQFNEQVWRIDLLPIELWEANQNHPLGYVVTLQSQQDMQLDLRRFMANQNSDFDYIIGKSPKMKVVIDQAKRFATLNAPLLIQGETGTGKDVFAKACHQLSFRRGQKFIAVNCAGLPAEEAESEMFGQHKNEQQSIGFFEYANGGTVLLDGVAELSLDMQAKLLRFLNDGSFRRVGEDQEIHVDVRVICTSQQPLSVLVAEGKIRKDLYHRLNVLTLNLPPLREREGDIPLLTDYFVQQICQQLGMRKLTYDAQFINALQSYSWAGNLRELYNVIFRACSLATDKLTVDNLDLPGGVNLNMDFTSLSKSKLEEGGLDELVSRFEANLLRQFYAEYPSTRKLAQRLGISHTAVANKLRTYGIGKV